MNIRSSCRYTNVLQKEINPRSTERNKTSNNRLSRHNYYWKQWQLDL